MLSPIKILDWELSRPTTDVPVSARYPTARVLVRWAGRPIGTVGVPVRSGCVARSDVTTRVLDRLIYPLIVEFVRSALLAKGASKVLPLEQPPSSNLRGHVPDVSVVICTRDRPDDLAICLAAVAALQPAPREVIIVDNASKTDATAELVRLRFPPFRYIREPKPGLDHARNAGIRAATGEIVAFTDDDVVVDSSWVGALADAFATDPSVGLVSGLIEPLELETEAQVLFETYGGFGRGYRRRYLEAPRLRRMPWHLIGTGQLGAGASMAIRRSLFAQMGLFDPALDVGTGTRGGGDHEIFFRVLKAGAVCLYEPAALVRHRHRRGRDELRRLLYDYGHGTRGFFDRVAHHFPEDVAELDRLRRWWWREWALKRWWNAFSRPSPLPASFVTAEINGYRQAAGAYARVRRALVPDETQRPDAFNLLPRSPAPLRGIGTLFIELSAALTDLNEAADYDTVNIVVQLHGEPLGSLRLRARGRSIPASRLAEEIAQTFALRILRPTEGGATAWASLVAELRTALGGAPAAAAPLGADVPVSIIVATCNRPDQLRRCLASLAELRSPRPIQTIVVDNRPGNEATARVVADFPGVELVSEPRAGSSFARNTGIAAATGEIVAMTDDDMVVAPDWLEKLLRPFARADVMAVTGNTLPARTETDAERCFETYGGFSRGFAALDFDSGWFFSFRRRAVPTWRIGGTGNAAFRRAMFAQPNIGTFDERLGAGMPTGVGEDTQIFYAILRAGFTIVYEPAAVAWHHHRISMPELRKQLYGYSKGHVAYHLVTLFDYGDTRALTRVLYELPASLLRRSWDRVRGTYAYPWRLLLTEIAGTLAGPWSLWRAHRVARVRRNAPDRSPGTPSPVRAAVNPVRMEVVR